MVEGIKMRTCGRTVAMRVLSLAAVLGLLVVWGAAPGASAAQAHAHAAGTASARSSLDCPPGTGTGAPGVTATTIKVAAISTLSGILAADFGSLVPGIKAYFDMVNAHGGVDGRTIQLAYNLDDAGLSSQFQADTHTAVDQDHAFAVAVSSYWFTPTYFAQTCTPTYGYDVNGNWSGAPNLFAAGGSVLSLKTIVPAVAYLADKTKSTSIAILAYNVSTSSDLCRTTGTLLRKAGYHVSFTDLKLTPIDANLTPDVERMQSAGSDFVVSCMTVTGNVALARAVKQYGLHVRQLWFDGADATVVKKYESLLQGVYFNVQNVPETAAQRFPGAYPGLSAYLKAMDRYSPGYAGNALALDGWESAALMVAGIRAAGPHLTQAAVVAATNKLTAFTAGGLQEPVDWKTSHTLPTTVACSAFEQVKGAVVEPVLGKGKQVYLCFDTATVRHPEPVAAPRGLPGPAG